MDIIRFNEFSEICFRKFTSSESKLPRPLEAGHKRFPISAGVRFSLGRSIIWHAILSAILNNKISEKKNVKKVFPLSYLTFSLVYISAQLGPSDSKIWQTKFFWKDISIKTKVIKTKKKHQGPIYSTIPVLGANES